MKTSETKTWQRTKTPGLLRHAGGKFYGRFSIGGKSKFVPLRTDLLEIARQRFAEEKAKVEKTRKAARANISGAARMADLLELERANVRARTDVEEPTRTRLINSIAYIEKTWPGFADLRPDQITRIEIEAWRARALKEGSGFRPPGAKSESVAVSGRSPTSFNKAFDALRRMLDYAVDSGSIHANPLLGRKGMKAKLSPRKVKLPEVQQLHKVFAEIERSGGLGGWPKETADFCRFIAYSGCRLAEVGALTWQDVDFDRGLIYVRGTKTEAANREVPLIKEARELLLTVQERRVKAATEMRDGQPYLDPRQPVFAVKEAEKSLTRACAAVGVPRLTHHDLRDAFATQAIEAGVDIPTVAGWLGHADGGALLMKVYAHHRRAHSVAQATKVSFGSPASAVPVPVPPS